MRDFLIGLILAASMIGFAAWVPNHVEPPPPEKNSGILEALRPG